MLNHAGVYQLTNGELAYIGQSVHMAKRVAKHLKKIKSASHDNHHLNKWYLSDITVTVLEDFGECQELISWLRNEDPSRQEYRIHGEYLTDYQLANHKVKRLLMAYERSHISSRDKLVNIASPLDYRFAQSILVYRIANKMMKPTYGIYLVDGEWLLETVETPEQLEKYFKTIWYGRVTNFGTQVLFLTIAERDSYIRRFLPSLLTSI